jgi:hypothetical protein
VRPPFERPMGLMRSASDFDEYDRPPLMGHQELDWESDRSRDSRKYSVEYVDDARNAKSLRRKKSYKRSKSC